MGRSTAAVVDVAIPVDSPSDLPYPASSARSGSAAIKRYTPHADAPPSRPSDDSVLRASDRRSRVRSQSSRSRKGCRLVMEAFFYCAVFGALVMFVLAIVMPQRLMRLGEVRQWGKRSGRGGVRGAEGFGDVLRFVPVDLLRRFGERQGLEKIRHEPRLGVRPPRLGIVSSNMKKDASSLIQLTIIKSLREIGYTLKVFAINDGESRSLWEKVGCEFSVLNSKNVDLVDWSIFDGVILSSIEAKLIISSLMQEPFLSVPLVWIIQEDTLAKRLPVYIENGWQPLILDWRNAFSRADVVIFPDFSLPMLYSVLDTGNFFVIPGSPGDALMAEIYSWSHSKYELRQISGFHEDDVLILVIGSSVIYDELPWDYAATLPALGHQLMKLATDDGSGSSFKFLFIGCNSTDGHDSTFQEITSHLGLPPGSVRHFGLDSDINQLMLMSDIVLYASFHDPQCFPSLLVRAMSFGVPIVVPDLPTMKKYVVDKVNGLVYRAHDVETLSRVFSLLVSDMELSPLAHAVAASAKLMSKNMFALDCLTDYMKLLENVVHFPSETILPQPTSELQQHTWEWPLFEKEIGWVGGKMQTQNKNSSVLYSIETQFVLKNVTANVSVNNSKILEDEFPTDLEWEEIGEIQVSEDSERRELEELDERTEKILGSWENIYNTARKSEKKKFELNERDEGELERIGRPLCIYEIYEGAGAWPFLHHGAIYRGISLSKGVERSRSDDVDAVARLPLLSDKQHRDLLCEFGGMLSVANKVDNIHKTPWIGFQSWRAMGRKVSLSMRAEKILEETIVSDTRGDVMYFWAKMELESKNERNDTVNFWSVCDILHSGNCSSMFGDAFRKMYELPSVVAALPPMPDDGDHWSTLHSWVMPTPSFLEFIMFSRMFVDSLHDLNHNFSSSNFCLLGSSNIERKHCYCRLLEILVNVWAYHSARKMVYINPSSGEFNEVHPIEQRKGLMWVKYFNFSLLKSMDEDLAEEADDDFQTRKGWLWPLTGEVHWQGILDREREERYRRKRDKQRKNMEKLIERQKYGYKQKALGG